MTPVYATNAKKMLKNIFIGKQERLRAPPQLTSYSCQDLHYESIYILRLQPSNKPRKNKTDNFSMIGGGRLDSGVRAMCAPSRFAGARSAHYCRPAIKHNSYLIPGLHELFFFKTSTLALANCHYFVVGSFFWVYPFQFHFPLHIVIAMSAARPLPQRVSCVSRHLCVGTSV